MSLFDRFKKSMRKAENHANSAHANKKAEKKEASKKAEVKVAREKKSKPAPKPAPIIPKKEFSGAGRIISRPLVTEKSTALNSLNQYAFEVRGEATKNEIRKAIQNLYGVKVEKVRIINVPGKTRRLGRHEGFHSGFKKAIVSVAQGQSIEIISG